MAHATSLRACSLLWWLIKQARLCPWASHSFFLVLLTLEFPWVDIAIEGPDPPPISLGVIERFEIAWIRPVPLQNPRPAVEDHFKLDVPHRASSLIVSKIRDANDAPVPVDHTAGVHFEEHDQLHPTVSDQRGKKGFGLDTAGLLKLGRIGKSQANDDLATLLQLCVPQDRFEAVAVEHI